ncbi:hypothetical protein [Solirubrobacter soli]|uniref:hypothetical protein n=1 Tax=Solirubrobacter soli TaxID=363832 RepID=UPI001FDEB594|nr:hypothetical protein [Solirubrobacter soli]
MRPPGSRSRATPAERPGRTSTCRHTPSSPDPVEVRLDGERFEPEPGQTVVSHGVDRDLSVGEAGALLL